MEVGISAGRLVKRSSRLNPARKNNRYFITRGLFCTTSKALLHKNTKPTLLGFIRSSPSARRNDLNFKQEFQRLWSSSTDGSVFDSIEGANRNRIKLGSESRMGSTRYFSSGGSKSAQLAESMIVDAVIPQPPPLNEVQVPLISPNLQSQIFPTDPSSIFTPSNPTQESIDISLAHLHSHGLAAVRDTSSKPPAPAIDFTLPVLHGPTIAHHFHALGQLSASPYLELAKDLASPLTDLPPIPEQGRWVLQPGWTFYSPDGSFESVRWPREDEEVLVFDIETLPYQGGNFPVMAVAGGKEGWYAWFSPWITGDDTEPNHLIPFSEPPPSSTNTSNTDDPLSLFEKEGSKPRLIIGHNVLFDRARVSSEYTLRRPNTRWLDTLSLHVAVSGITNPQRPSWAAHQKEQAKEGIDSEENGISPNPATKSKAAAKSVNSSTPQLPEGASKRWQDLSSPNSLVEVAKLHLGTKIDKSIRNIFIDPAVTIEEAREHFDQLIHYCANDVLTTYGVFKVLLPKFLQTCPHPISFAGILLMSQPILPVDEKWPKYLERAEGVYQERAKQVKGSLELLAEKARSQFHEVDKDGRPVWEKDIWLSQLDWSPKKARRIVTAASIKKEKKKEQVNLPGASLGVPIINESTPLSSLVSKKVVVAPSWYSSLESTSNQLNDIPIQSTLASLLFQTSWRSYPTVFSTTRGWLFAVATASKKKFIPEAKEELVSIKDLGPKDEFIKSLKGYKFYSIPAGGTGRCLTLLGWTAIKKIVDGSLKSPYKEMEEGVKLGKETKGKAYDSVQRKLKALAREAVDLPSEVREKNFWLRQLDWTEGSSSETISIPHTSSPEIMDLPTHDGDILSSTLVDDLVWPKWYKDLDDVHTRGIDISIGKRATPLLLKLKWKGYPIVHSVKHGWIYRVPNKEVFDLIASEEKLKELNFDGKDLDKDINLADDKEASYFQLPHPDGEGKNVGSPLSRSFIGAFENQVLTSEYTVAADALALNASCSYWTSSRERIINQMVVWGGDPKIPSPTPTNLSNKLSPSSIKGLILPQVIPMGTVTRRAVEKTWLTASNAKKNRVGSELKSMVQAPPGYAIVGADVDSEELWICSVMGDAQFGIHGATAIGWMTLEGTKASGTDLHSKTAKILGISRDDAKVFNYSRIYGAGQKHAIQLLLKANPALTESAAKASCLELYASTKGLVDRSTSFHRTFWHGGTESFVFNKLEGIAHSDIPITPALGCGITDALKKDHLPAEGRQKAGQGFMPSRVNWVVQSSGVDYLHLLIVSMEYLTRRFGIDARYMISVHDEVRYIVKEEDKFRAAMAMQISNLWTRSLFSYRLQMRSLPESCAFFSAVDIDHCFRKEVNMNCLTPSNPDPIPFGISYDISDSLASTSNGSLFADGRSMEFDRALPSIPYPFDLTEQEIKGEIHRVNTSEFLIAQTKSSASEVKRIWNELEAAGKKKKQTKHKVVNSLIKKLGVKPVKKSEEPREYVNDWDEIMAAVANDKVNVPVSAITSRTRSRVSSVRKPSITRSAIPGTFPEVVPVVKLRRNPEKTYSFARPPPPSSSLLSLSSKSKQKFVPSVPLRIEAEEDWTPAMSKKLEEEYGRDLTARATFKAEG